MEPHRWQFVRAGGVDQVVIRTADIAHLAQLTKNFLGGAGLPDAGVEFDATLDAIDSDGDGRIRAPESACCPPVGRAQVRDPEVLTSTSDVLQLDSLQTEVEDGPAMLAEAQRILALAGQAGASSLSLAHAQQRLAELHAMLFNGDGVLSLQALQTHPDLQTLAQRIMEAYGSVQGCDDQPGLAQPPLSSFLPICRPRPIGWCKALSSCKDSPSPEQAQAQALSAVQAMWTTFLRVASSRRSIPRRCSP